MYTYSKERDIYSIYACISKFLSNTAIRILQACGTDQKDAYILTHGLGITSSKLNETLKVSMILHSKKCINYRDRPKSKWKQTY